MIHLVLGAARSGKSRFAQQQAIQSDQSVTYLATAIATDDEMTARIARHKTDRPAHWQLVEQSTRLPEVLKNLQAPKDAVILVDCLTLWLNNEMYLNPESSIEELQRELILALETSTRDLILVSNEVGMGIVPVSASARKFADWQGWLNQAVADVADKVTLVVAGLPMNIKG